MNKVYFNNEGVIDLTSITTFGINAKETDNPFGYFGTGLKYAIAILLRAGQKVTVYTGLEEHIFSVNKKTVRGKDFDIVCMDGVEIGFTLELGKNWELWQAYRELYCNTLDENGVILTDEILPSDEFTTIVIEGDEFFNIHLNKNQIVLDSNPFASFPGVDVHLGSSESLYMKTIKVLDLPVSCIYSYNFTSSIQLSEDRTIKYMHDANSAIRRALLTGDNVDYIKAFATAPDGSFEQRLDCDGWSETPSDIFIETIKSIDFKKITNNTILSLYRKHTNTRKTPTKADITDIEKKQVEKAIDVCKYIGYDPSEYIINISNDLRENVLGMVYDNEIYLSRRVFEQGTKQVAATLLEEYLHIDRGYHDETYKFQTYLFDVIMTLTERLKGDPI